VVPDDADFEALARAVADAVVERSSAKR